MGGPHLIRTRIAKALTITAAAAIAGAVAMILIEIWVRSAWDESRGRPGFFINDPVLGRKIAHAYRVRILPILG